MSGLAPGVRIKLAPLSFESADTKYDVLIAACGYETRSRSTAESMEARPSEIWAYDYSDNRILAYDENADFFRASGTLIAVSAAALRDDLLSRLSDLERRCAKVLQVAVDISSMDRDRLASVVNALLADRSDPISVDFLYTPGQFDERMSGSAGTIRVNRPAMGLEGWASDPDLPLACILGLGFENELALAALESLEPSESFLFSPRGVDPRYDEIVETSNQLLAGSGSLRLLSYELDQPLTTFRSIESLVHSLVGRNRVVIVPVGPKIFALAAMLIGVGYGDEVSVWRVSSGADRVPEDRLPSEKIVGLRLFLDRSVEVEAEKPESVAVG